MAVEEGFEFVGETRGIVESGERVGGHHSACFELDTMAM